MGFQPPELTEDGQQAGWFQRNGQATSRCCTPYNHASKDDESGPTVCANAASNPILLHSIAATAPGRIWTGPAVSSTQASASRGRHQCTERHSACLGRRRGSLWAAGVPCGSPRDLGISRDHVLMISRQIAGVEVTAVTTCSMSISNVSSAFWAELCFIAHSRPIHFELDPHYSGSALGNPSVTQRRLFYPKAGAGISSSDRNVG